MSWVRFKNRILCWIRHRDLSTWDLRWIVHIIAIILLLFFAYSFFTIITSRICLGNLTPSISPFYPSHPGTTGMSLDLQIELSELNLKTLQTRSTYFLISAYDQQGRKTPFKLFLLAPKDLPIVVNSGIPSGDPNTTTNHVAYIMLSPAQSILYWTWNLRAYGEFPFERYQLSYLICFNRTFQLDNGLVSLITSLNSSLKDNWNFNITFTHLKDRLDNATLESMGLSPIYFNQYGKDLQDFYLLKLNLFRDDSYNRRVFFMTWVPLEGILVLLSLTMIKIPRYNSIMLYLPTLLSIIASMLGILSFLPPRMTILELLFYIDIIMSFINVIFSISFSKET